MNEEEIRGALALKLTPGVGDVLAKQLISYCGSAHAIFKEKKGVLKKIPNIGPKTIEALNASEHLHLAEKIRSHCLKHNIRIVPYFDPEYPKQLKELNDAPLLLYAKGRITFGDRPIVSIVGTRQATNYGKKTTEKIVEDLASSQTIIVSGLAYGIDISAHRASLKNGMSTVAVLAGGLDKIYPAAHKKVALEMLENGGWICEYPPGVEPEAHNFPARNRIIAGMSEAVIVVEAANKGGALITANIAYSYNREVFAVPGSLEHKFSAGCNLLIRNQRANIYTGVEDLKYLLGWDVDDAVPRQIKKDLSKCSLSEQKIMNMLYEYESGLHLDELSWKTQISVNEVVACLLNLEFDGLLKSLPGKRYIAV